MLTVFAALTPIFLAIATGFALRKSGLLPPEQWRGVELLCYWLLFPALLIVSLARSRVSFAELSSYAWGLAFMVVTMTLVTWLLRRPLRAWMKMSGPTYSSLFQTVTRWNGFIAMAIIDDLYGPRGVAMLALAFAILIPWLNVVNIAVLATCAGKSKPTPRMILMAVARNPLIIGVGLGLAVKLSGLTLPGPIINTLDLIGRGALGLTLLALGAGLSWRAVRTAGPEIALSLVLRLIGMPLVAAFSGWLFGVSGAPLVIMVIATAVPTAVNGYILARAMGGDAEYYAAAVTAQVMASFLTLPPVIWLAMRMAG